MGFTFNNGSILIGPLAIFPKTILCWNIRSGKEINEKSLSLFIALEPKPDVVVLGLETAYNFNEILKINQIFNDKGIAVEVLPVEHACGIYNFLCDDGRYVVAGLIPPVAKINDPLKRLRNSIYNTETQKIIDAS